MAERCDSSWIQTFTGRQFWPMSPRAGEVHIEDIAHALSNLCRYTGHVREFYSVAQHCYLASHIVPPADALWALLHDASEAYLADIARPIKRMLANYREAEEALMRCIADRFNLPWPEPESVKAADLVMLATERRDLMAAPPRSWISTENVKPMMWVIRPLNPARAKKQFLERFEELEKF